MTTIEKTPLGRLDQEGRLLNAVLKSPTTKPGRFGFRGDIALKFKLNSRTKSVPRNFRSNRFSRLPRKGRRQFPFWPAICTPSHIWNRSLKSLATF